MKVLTRKQVLAQGYEVYVSGIPCLACVTYHAAGRPAQLYGPAENCYPAEDPELEFDLFDRKGYKAAWLERKMTEKDADRIIEDIYEQMALAYDPF